MKKLLLLSTLLFALNLCAQIQTTLGFEESPLPLDTVEVADATDTIKILEFEGLQFPSLFTGFWSGGWARSTSRNDSTGDFTNLYGAASGQGALGSNTYMVGQNGSYILFPERAAFSSIEVSATTYNADVVEFGSAFSRPFGTNDSLMNVEDSLILVLRGYLDNSFAFEQRIPLADYRFADSSEDYIQRSWTTFAATNQCTDFTAIDSLSFSMMSSDNGQFGNNTPDFFAIDELCVYKDIQSSISEVASTSFVVSPNPSSAEIKLSSAINFLNAQIFSMQGQRIGSFKLNDSQNIDISHLPRGTYLVKAITATGQISVQRFIKS